MKVTVFTDRYCPVDIVLISIPQVSCFLTKLHHNVAKV